MQYMGNKLRHELKYFIGLHEYRYLSARLATMLRLDENSVDRDYKISSIYFDDIYHSALKEKEAGIQMRQKYRIRLYNRQDGVIHLERKDKFGEFISKKSIRITRAQYDALLNGGDIRFLLDSESKFAQEMYGTIKSRLLRPVVIVEYDREAYILNEGNVRLTFDKDLQAGFNTCDLFSPNLMYTSVLEPGTMILEVKYDDYLPTYVKSLLQIPAHNRSAASKYVLCRELQMERNPVSFFGTSPVFYDTAGASPGSAG
jgi:hypothetical protein